jgi:hypothetical protein
VSSAIANGQPVANASVAALVAQGSSEGTIFNVWEESQSGQVNPQVTASDGKYSYSATSGFYRIDVVAAGYQPYRTADLDAGAGSISPNIALSPVISKPRRRHLSPKMAI